MDTEADDEVESLFSTAPDINDVEPLCQGLENTTVAGKVRTFH